MFDAAVKPENDGDFRPDSTRPSTRTVHVARFRTIPLLLTLTVTALAIAFGWATWTVYMKAPWTRDGTVRTYVITMAPEVAGRIVEVPVTDNQFVRKGDLLVLVDSVDYRNALQLAEASVAQTQATSTNAQQQSERRHRLTDLAETVEDMQSFEANARVTSAQHQQALVNREQAKVNLQRTEIRSPVDGWVTNLLARPGDYATVGKNVISVVDANAFWVDAYFEETKLATIHEGDSAKIKLMGYSQVISGEVAGLARGIMIANAQADPQGLATVNPIYTWVRLAQRVPVRIRITHVPDGIRLVAGLTATVEVEPKAR